MSLVVTSWIGMEWSH